jgi:hypothetical protein
MTSEQDRALKERLKAELGEGNVIFASTKWTGVMAFRKPTEEQYLNYLGSLASPLESSGIAQEQFAIDCLAHPTEDAAKGKLRRVLKAMPNLAQDLARSIEALACGDYSELDLSAEEKLKLDKRWEFGWGGLTPTGKAPVVMATDEMAGTLTRIASDSRANGDNDNGRKIRAAVLALVRSPEQVTMEALLEERPALLMPLWYRAQELVGSGVAEVGKG